MPEKNNQNTIRVRIAPSPTGKLHLGTARTALFNYLYAKKTGGTFVLRIEDTDQERSEAHYTQDILDCLEWLEIKWDEGPKVGGPAGPYAQSERLNLYQEQLAKLLSTQKAYKCFCSSAELEAERQAQQAKGQAPKYSGKCRHLTDAEVVVLEAAGKPFNVRLKVEPRSIEFHDLVRGTVRFDAGLFGDFAITRTDGSPLFLLTNTIDDHLMAISHVLRGEDHLSNTAKQILLSEALGFPSPQFGHLPLILNTDRSKLSKRRNPVSVTDDYRAKGYLPEALVNYLALLGWASGDDKELYTMSELIKVFSIDRVGKSPAIFDQEKLLWLNGYYIRHLPIGELGDRIKPFLTDEVITKAVADRPEFYLQTLLLVQERLQTLAEAEELISFCYHPPHYAADLLVAKKSTAERAALALEVAEAALKKVKSFTLDELEVALRAAAGAHELKDGEVLWAVRAALTGLPASPGAFEVLEVLGREESLKRIANARKKLES